MNDPAASLDRLNDVVLPPTPAAWPPAPGWWLIAALVLTGAAALAYHIASRRRSEAYRRHALAALANAGNIRTVAEILRRTALAFSPRHNVAGRHGNAWIDWLAEHGPAPPDTETRRLLALGPYSPQADEPPPESVRRYAEQWIRRHRRPECPESTSRPPC